MSEMTWLDKIEKRIREDKALAGNKGFVPKDVIRLSTVLRLLVEYIKAEDDLPMKYDTKEAAEKAYELRRKLLSAPDVAALLEGNDVLPKQS